MDHHTYTAPILFRFIINIYKSKIHCSKTVTVFDLFVWRMKGAYTGPHRCLLLLTFRYHGFKGMDSETSVTLLCNHRAKLIFNKIPKCMCICICVNFQVNIFPLKTVTLWDLVMHLVYFNTSLYFPLKRPHRPHQKSYIQSVLSISFKSDNDLQLITPVMWRTKGKLLKAKENEHYSRKPDEP